MHGWWHEQKVSADDEQLPGHVEIDLFEQAEGADHGAVRAFITKITRKMNQNDTLLNRTVGQSDDGIWLRVNYWTNRPDMETQNAQAQSWADEVTVMRDLVIMTSPI